MSLTPEQAKIIKATVPILAEHGMTITSRFYANMLRENKELNNIFNTSNQHNGHQPKSLAMALYAYASNIDDLGVLSPAVELICHKHASLYIRPEHYNIVGTYLLAAMKEILGDALTQDIHDAWAAAYWQLANIMIAREADLYKSADGWADWREFKIDRKEKESDEITSFYLVPLDGKPLPKFKPGQYISVQTEVPDLSHLQARQYSLSEAPRSDYYRISVKREDGLNMSDPAAPAHPGYISNLLHKHKQPGDVLRVSHPYGDFFYDESAVAPTAPIVFLAAGVGLTCLLSIFNSLAAAETAHPITWVHVARTTSARAFAPHVRAAAARNPRIQPVFFLSHPGAGDVQGQDFDVPGRLELGKLDAEKQLHAKDATAQYFVCGPEQFMVDMQKGLKELGVDEGRIHLELFGTGGVPKA
ncbi:globin-like protein [Schizophyllum commune H4-8]|uniref:nitric oxide dioxygenase n=1 Tax=Schizophyllum commune (strain H4-8 / FGSC 9210) TaxID=578458 RepID=D8Q402_SCHCM|nr:globin-like protein [Schizophyllum commune H4-8]KAI5892812.1 globin-like protein [Schizophyllum commune H4-8]